MGNYFSKRNPVDHALWYGVLAFAFSFANFLGAPLLGALSDRYGRRRVLLIGFGGLGFNFFAIAYASDLAWLIVVRMIGGFLQSNAAIANAYVADISSPEERARRFGMLGAMFGIGFILGPAMGGLLGAIDIHLPFFAAGTLAIANWLYGFFVLPESLPPERRRAFEWRRANPFAALRRLGALKGVGPLIAVIALANLAQFTLHSSWVLHNTFKFGWGPAENGWSLFVVGVMSALVQGVLLRHLLKRFSPQRLATVGLIASALTYLGFGLATQGWMIFVVIVVGTLLGGGAQAAIQSLVSNAADAHSQGQTAGSVASLTSLMAVLAPTIAAPLLGIVSHLPRGDMRIGLPFFFCALLQAAGAIIAFLHFRRQRAGHAPATA